MDILKKLATSILTEKLVKKIMLFLLKELAKRSTNKIDDEIVKLVEEALSDK